MSNFEIKMLNADLLSLEDIKAARLQRRIENLEKQISDFKEYDKARKKYYGRCLTKLGELESYVQELEDGTAIEELKRLNKEYKKQLNVLSKRVFLDRIATLTDTEVEVLFSNLELMEKLKAEKKISENLREINSKLIAELCKCRKYN